MLSHKSFIDIKAFQIKFSDCFEAGDIISIQEKLDGSNSSIQYDPETDSLMCFSRKMILNPMNTLNGFYEYVQKLDKTIFKKYPNFRLFGEWSLKHLIRYEESQIKKFHCFDIYDTENKQWQSRDVVKNICAEANIQMIPELYYGEFISWEHVQSFIGKTVFGLSTGEGIVLKNQTKLNNPNEKKPFVVKLVATEYLETAQRKIREPINPDELAKREYLYELASTIVTENRVEKSIYKMIMNDELPSDWDETHMGFIAKELPRIIYNDCIKEENETVEKIEGFGKLCASIVMQIVRKLLASK